MSTYNERFSADIELNTEKAKSQLEELKKRQTELQNLQKQLDSKKDKSGIVKTQKELDKLSNAIERQEHYVKTLDTSLEKLSEQSYNDLQQTVKRLERALKSKAIKDTSEEYKEITERIRACKAEMAKFREELVDQESVWKRCINILNKNWGAITQFIGAMTGAGVSIRKFVDDYAQMEEAMADTRKYTGLTKEGVDDLNEALKKIDTRTSRQELNELAGSAGRLGITSKQDILDFIDAADKIKVALGDDLGEGAIDQVGKLAMAFGEDDRMGLRQAMLATGSALNELAQNSSSQAGYLVDYTARVAGFGKQLGLTQAQIMGFGAVMDENMLRDEMAATAFGNMLTKMQTDTAKFAKIAGMDVKAFTKLLNEDANGAILRLAENLKKQDPQSMMNMLSDMGLDGSRAIGVLSTLADKIGDVRERQTLATQAYADATSVIGEFDTMNDTVQARIDKAKKEFMEISVELGEKLLPIVKYAINAGTIFASVLSVLVTTLLKLRITIVTTTLTLTALYIAKKKDAIITELQTFWHEKLIVSLKKLKVEMMKNPWTIMAVAMGVVIGLLIDYVANTKEAIKNQKHLNDVTRESSAIAANKKAIEEEANKTSAEEIAKIKQLTATLENNKNSYDKRKKALDEIRKICPAYHGQLTQENQLINSNTSALDDYISNLKRAARAQAAFNRMVAIEENSMNHERLLNDRRSNLQWAQQQLGKLGANENSTFVWTSGFATRAKLYNTDGKYVRDITAQEASRIKKMQDLIKYNRERIAEEEKSLAINQKLSEETQKIADANKPDDKKKTSPTKPYVSDAERKKQEIEAKKLAAKEKQEENERRKKLKEADSKAKADMDERLADNMLSYKAGLKDYRQYITDQQKIQEDGLKARMSVWDEESNEYKKYSKQLAALQLNGDDAASGMKLDDLEYDHQKKMLQIKKYFADEKDSSLHDEDALNEALYREDINYMQAKAQLYRKGSLERMRIEQEIEMRETEHKMDNERTFMQKLQDYRQQKGKTDADIREQVELDALSKMYAHLKARGIMEETEYQDIIKEVRARYAKQRADDAETGLQTAQQSTSSSVHSDRMREITAKAKTKAVKKRDEREGETTSIGEFFVGEIQQYADSFAAFKEMCDNKEITYKEMLEGMAQTSGEMAGAIADRLSAAINAVAPLMNSLNSFYSAQSDYEVAMVEKKYEKQINAASNNEKRQKKLEEKKEKEIAAIKTKYNKKQTKIQIAQAIASTALSALNAYASAMAGVPYPANLVLAPVAASIATAAGMLQVAAIKKQAKAQEAGYYEGGFTRGHRYRKEAGVVHEGEFVANHIAVGNPNVLPLLEFIDRAQRNNTIGSLTAEDISRQIGGPSVVSPVTPVVNVQSDNAEMAETYEKLKTVVENLQTRLDDGIQAYVVIDGPKGLHKQYEHFKDLHNV